MTIRVFVAPSFADVPTNVKSVSFTAVLNFPPLVDKKFCAVIVCKAVTVCDVVAAETSKFVVVIVAALAVVVVNDDVSKDVNLPVWGSVVPMGVFSKTKARSVFETAAPPATVRLPVVSDVESESLMTSTVVNLPLLADVFPIGL